MASPILAVILSFIIPGLGQFYTGQFIKAVGLILAAIASARLSSYLYLPLVTTGTFPSLSNNIIPVIALLIYIYIWLYSMHDAYCAAKSK